MKIMGRKVPKGNFLLFLSFVAVSLCILIILSASRLNQQNNLSQNNLYTEHSRNFSISYAESEDRWEGAIADLSSKYDNFAIYIPIKGEEPEARGIYICGEVDIPPVIEGKYFNQSTSWSDTPAMVLGKEYEKDIIRRDGRMYYKYAGIEFEVIGVIGTEKESRLNYMILMDFKSGLKQTGVNTDYVLDAGKAAAITEIGRELNTHFTSPANFIMILNDVETSFSIADFFSSDSIMQTMFVMILISFFLSTVLVSFIWYRYRNQLRIIWVLSGYQKRYMLLEIAKRFYVTAFAGFGAGVLLMSIVPLVMEGIDMNVIDVLQAFGMTVGLGTVILLVCCFYDKNKVEI